MLSSICWIFQCVLNILLSFNVAVSHILENILLTNFHNCFFPTEEYVCDTVVYLVFLEKTTKNLIIFIKFCFYFLDALKN